MTFKPNWLRIYMDFALTAIFFSFMGVLITWSAIQETRQGLPLSGGWSWPIVIGLDVFSLIIVLWFAWFYYSATTLTVTDDYISCRSLLGTKAIRWTKVTGYTTGINITINSNQGKIIVAYRVFAEPDEMMGVVLRHLHLHKGGPSNEQ